MYGIAISQINLFVDTDSNNVMTYGQMNTTYDGSDHESVHHSTRGGKKYTHYDFQSTDSFEFSDEETHYWKQAREVMKRNPSKSVLQRQGRGHRNSKLVRFGSVVRKFDKLDELLQESQEMDDEGTHTIIIKQSIKFR